MIDIDCSIMKIHFESSNFEWIYRGSKRLAPMFKSTAEGTTRGYQKRNDPQIEYVTIDDNESSPVQKRAVAKKSTATRPLSLQQNVPQPVAQAVNQQGNSGAVPHRPVKILNDDIIYIDEAPKVGKVWKIHFYYYLNRYFINRFIFPVPPFHTAQRYSCQGIQASCLWS